MTCILLFDQLINTDMLQKVTTKKKATCMFALTRNFNLFNLKYEPPGEKSCFRGFRSSKPQTCMPRYGNEDTCTCIILLKQVTTMVQRTTKALVRLCTCRDIEIRSILYIVNKDTDQALQICRLLNLSLRCSHTSY